MPKNGAHGPDTLRRSLALITVAGCLAMIYVAGTTSPAFVAFVRALGATEAHFGLLGGIPLIMLSMQFLGAVLTNVPPRRKPLFMALAIAAFESWRIETAMACSDPKCAIAKKDRRGKRNEPDEPAEHSVLHC